MAILNDPVTVGRASVERFVTKGSTAAQHTTRLARQFGHAAGIPGGLMALCVLLFGTVASQAVTDLLTTPLSKGLALAATGAGAVASFHRWNTAYLSAAAEDDTYGMPGTQSLPQRRGLVLLCGLNSGQPTSEAAVLLGRLPSLEYLAIVGTPETRANGAIDAVRNRLLTAAGHQLPNSHVRTWDFGHSASISDAKQATAEALRWLLSRGLDPTSVVVDVSAGRRPMQFGANNAADDFRVETQYWTEEWDSRLNAPVPGTKHFKIIKVYDPA